MNSLPHNSADDANARVQRSNDDERSSDGERSNTPDERNDRGADSTRRNVFRHLLRRRSFLTGGLGAGVALGASGLAACGHEDDNATTSSSEALDQREKNAADAVSNAAGLTGIADQTVPFDGPHQAGIDTPSQAYVNVVGINCIEGIDKKAMQRLMEVWTSTSRKLTQGQPPLAELEPEMVSRPANLTVTIGFGRPLLDKLQMHDKIPSWLHDIPAFDRDRLDDAWGQTDIALQICSDDPTTLAHARRFILRAGQRYTEPVWEQQGFLYAAGAQAKGSTPRNLFGVLDGTVNPRSDKELSDIVWINDGPAWLRGGTAMVIRRISLNLDSWDILDRSSREVVFGRKLKSGAPLTGEKEFDDPDFDKVDSTGLPVIDPESHMARAHYEGNNTHEQILRRAFNYSLPVSGPHSPISDAGLIFTCFQQNPDTQFTPIQKRLDQSDRLNEWITHIGSAVYAVPHGTAGEDNYWADDLLA